MLVLGPGACNALLFAVLSVGSFQCAAVRGIKSEGSSPLFVPLL